MTTKTLNLSNFINPDVLTEDDKEPHLSKKTIEKLEDLTPKQKEEIEKDKKADYGQECILDISDVPLELFTNKLIDDFAGIGDCWHLAQGGSQVWLCCYAIYFSFECTRKFSSVSCSDCVICVF